jgi:hypothetical protein
LQNVQRGCGSAAARHASHPPRWLAPVRANGRRL